MSNLIFPNEAKIKWAQAQIDNALTLTDCFLRLFKNSLIVDSATTLAELNAAEADYLGYAPIQLINWSDAIIADSKAATEADAVSFQADEETEGDLYGCYATDGAGVRLWFASAFDSPVPIPFEAPLEIVIQVDFDSIFNA